jgi:hypothetical protein
VNRRLYPQAGFQGFIQVADGVARHGFASVSIDAIIGDDCMSIQRVCGAPVLGRLALQSAVDPYRSDR